MCNVACQCVTPEAPDGIQKHNGKNCNNSVTCRIYNLRAISLPCNAGTRIPPSPPYHLVASVEEWLCIRPPSGAPTAKLFQVPKRFHDAFTTQSVQRPEDHNVELFLTRGQHHSPELIRSFVPLPETMSQNSATTIHVSRWQNALSWISWFVVSCFVNCCSHDGGMHASAIGSTRTSSSQVRSAPAQGRLWLLEPYISPSPPISLRPPRLASTYDRRTGVTTVLSQAAADDGGNAQWNGVIYLKVLSPRVCWVRRNCRPKLRPPRIS
jgi:hypothetical protein